MPLCNLRNETAGLITGCCTETNCNEVHVPAIVSECYDGGIYTDAVKKVNITLPIQSTECSSPDNQYCQVEIIFSIFKTFQHFLYLKKNSIWMDILLATKANHSAATIAHHNVLIKLIQNLKATLLVVKQTIAMYQKK